MSGPVSIEVAAGPSKSEMPYTSLRDILRRKLAWHWLIERLLKRGGVYQLHGQWKAGKSLVATDMALHLAQGKDWCGRRCIHALVVYVAGEAVEDIEARIQAFSMAHGLADDAPFYLRTKPVYLTSEVFAQGLADEISELRKEWPNLPVVVFVDTLARNFGPGKSESSDADMGAFINNVIDLVARPHKATAIVVHHPGHGAKDRGRGHSSLPGAVDGTLMVEQRDGVVMLTTTEMRNVASDEMALAWTIRGVDLDSVDNFGNAVSAPVLVAQDDVPEFGGDPKGLGANQKHGLAILTDLFKQAQVNTEATGAVPRIPWDIWRAAMEAEGIARNKTYAVRDALLGRRLIDKHGNNFILTTEIDP